MSFNPTSQLQTKWSAPLLCFDGYATVARASVQLADGEIVKAYYANGIRAHRCYHMGVVRWRADK